MDQRPKWKGQNYRTLRRKDKGKASWHLIWQLFLGYNTKDKAIKEKIDKLYYIKNKNFCASKDTFNRVESWPMEWNKLFANHNKGLIFRIYKEFLQVNNKIQLELKMGKGLEMIFLQRSCTDG